MKIRKRWILLLALMVTIGAMTVGCGNGPVEDGESERVEGVENNEEAFTITDMEGNEIDLHRPVERLSNAWPSSATMTIALGAGDKLVSTHKYIQTLPLNSYIYDGLMDIATDAENAEEILNYEPDVVVVNNDEDYEMYSKVGLKPVNMMFNNYDTMKQSVNILGTMLGGDFKNKTDDLIGYIESNIELVEEKLADVKEEDKPTAYYAIGDMYSSTGAGTMMEEWTTYAGGRFATSDLGDGMNVEVNAEDILAKNPDIIFVSGGADSKGVVEGFKTSPEWQNINAVKNDNIHIIPLGCFAWDRFGAESSMQILWAANKMYPDLIDIDMKDEAREFYKKYSDYDIPEEILDKVMSGSIDYEINE